jgi:hypothetical protein
MMTRQTRQRPSRHSKIQAAILFAVFIFGVIALVWLLLSSPASARTCDGLVTSGNSCIGSSSNVDSYNNHEPIDTTICGARAGDVCDGGNRQLGDAIKPHRLTARQKANIERTRQHLLKEIRPK